MSRNLRLQYSGLIIFSSQLIGVATGLIFTLLLTRNMAVAQYGVWTNIFDYTAYFTIFSGLLPFWATRFVARSKEGAAKTSTLAQLVISLISMAIYFPVIFLIYTLAIAKRIGESYLPIFLIAGLYILTFYMITNFESILQSVRPQALGYGFLIEEIVKVSVAFVLIVGFKQLFLGAVLALVLSCFVQIGYYVSLLRDELKGKVNWGYLKEWLKGSTALAYNAIGGQLSSFTYILLFFYGGANTRAYFQAASSFTIVIGYSISLSTALYPKLLARNCSKEQVGDSFRTVMMMAIPLTAITFVMSISFLTILKTAYGVAWPVLIAMSINTFINTIYQFYYYCLAGIEAFDAEGKISMHHLVRSKIFKMFSLQYIQAAISIPLAYFVLTMLPVAGSVKAAFYVIIILIGVQISTFAVLYWLMRRAICVPIAWKSIAKYVLSAAVMAIILFLAPTTTTLLATIVKAIIGLGIYVALLVAIDKQARHLVRLISKEFRETMSQLTSKKQDENAFENENDAGKNGKSMST
ncbi:MAG TPA: hypothetical protein VJY36_06855 [Candidatus Bathyarchaeia archaeon]|nr:hypothetical protein [Candidatus Bathyarchaeia archaeon]